MHDLIIIGAGPAGITAGVYAARQNLDFLLLSRDIGGQAAWSGQIGNYTGYQLISGPELVEKFQEHMRQYNIALKENESAERIFALEDAFSVQTDKAQYQGRSVIIATGKRSRNLGLAKEEYFRNRGLTYCATCDGPLFFKKDVAVIGGGNSALDAAIQLEHIANFVYLVNNTASLGGDALMRQKVEHSAKVKVMNNANVIDIKGENFVQALTIRQLGKEAEIPVSGVFVEIGLVPNSDLMDNLDKNEQGEIKVDAYNQTNLSGIFAAGDVTDVPEKQIIIAAGEGAKAAISVFKYLARKPAWADKLP
ncbi:MAG: FAD-dependent oxidoreductase [Candidatus Omnitrophota bacterium]